MPAAWCVGGRAEGAGCSPHLFWAGLPGHRLYQATHPSTVLLFLLQYILLVLGCFLGLLRNRCCFVYVRYSFEFCFAKILKQRLWAVSFHFLLSETWRWQLNLVEKQTYSHNHSFLHYLKWTVSRNFRTVFYHQTSPIRPSIHIQKFSKRVANLPRYSSFKSPVTPLSQRRHRRVNFINF
jgi:hypothetical protein